MFTVLMTIVGLIVFVVSLIKRSFKKAFLRLIGFVVTGIVIDVIMLSALTGAAYHNLH